MAQRARLVGPALALALVTATLSASLVSAAPTYRVFATREGLVGETTANGHEIQERDHFVALPSEKALTCDGCHGKEVEVCNPANGRCAVEPVWDVGPWNTEDDYWNPSQDRERFADLPRGTPEAEAAYQDDYNEKACEDPNTGETRVDGADQFDRCVLNPAGIDLADGTFWDDLGMDGNGWVDVTYLWVGGGPAITVTEPDLTSWQEGTVEVRAEIQAEVDLAWARARIDQGPWQWDTPTPHTWTFDTRDLVDGEHVLHVQAENEAGDRGDEATPLKVDNGPPEPTITNPPDGALVPGYTRVEVDAPDAGSGTEAVAFHVDGEHRYTDDETPWRWGWLAALEPGWHTVTAEARDALGHAARDSVDVFVV